MEHEDSNNNQVAEVADQPMEFHVIPPPHQLWSSVTRGEPYYENQPVSASSSPGDENIPPPNQLFGRMPVLAALSPLGAPQRTVLQNTPVGEDGRSLLEEAYAHLGGFVVRARKRDNDHLPLAEPIPIKLIIIGEERNYGDNIHHLPNCKCFDQKAKGSESTDSFESMEEETMEESSS